MAAMGYCLLVSSDGWSQRLTFPQKIGSYAQNMYKKQLLKAIDCLTPNETHEMPKEYAIHAIHWLLEQGVDPNTYVNEKNTVLMQAVRLNCLEVMKDLVAHGADRNIKDVFDGTNPCVIFLQSLKIIKEEPVENYHSIFDDD